MALSLTHLSPKVKAKAELERRKRAAHRAVQYLPELEQCAASSDHFINNYCKIYDATLKGWIPFKLWREQIEVLVTLQNNQLVIILKARQLGLSWLVVAYALWLMMFHPAATILIFSLRETEAIYLLDERLKGMFKQLPDWMLMKTTVNGIEEWVPRTATIESSKHWQLANGSSARAFSTNSGDSYTATMAIVDEADLVPDLNKLMRRVKPTIDGGGQMVLLSRVDKSVPQSEFKKIYKGAKRGATDWKGIFLPWNVRPSRTAEWYERQRAEILERTESLDDLWEQYPSTDAEALAPRSLDKRIPPKWLLKVFEEIQHMSDEALAHVKGLPSINGLKIFKLPEEGRKYIEGLDPAEGNPTSDDSALNICDEHTGEQVASLKGKFQPSVLASHGDTLGMFYNKASVMIERNNHGHAVIMWFEEHSKLKLLNGPDDKPGWLDNARGKVLLYDNCADTVRTEDCIIHSFDTYEQLGSVEGSTLRAPEGEPDDDADAWALCMAGRTKVPKQNKKAAVSAPRTVMVTLADRLKRL